MVVVVVRHQEHHELHIYTTEVWFKILIKNKTKYFKQVTKLQDQRVPMLASAEL